MQIITSWATDKGNFRSDNQDCCYVRKADNICGLTCIAAICDGMGGLNDGYFASSTVCQEVAKWYEISFLRGNTKKNYSDDDIYICIETVLKTANTRLCEYGQKHSVKTGTTASVLFIIADRYYVIHVGDSRIYHYSNNLKQITLDDSVASEKLRRGEISMEEYNCSKEKHILSACVGVSDKLRLQFYSGRISEGDVFFLCTDGMYHELTDEELESTLVRQRHENGQNVQACLSRLVDKVISRGERDNVTGAMVICM